MQASQSIKLNNENSPLVSIVILTYKKFKYVWEAIDSVYTQDYPFIQLIISDDGSDNFPKFEIERYLQNKKATNIQSYKIIHHEQNVGTVKNLNIAYDNADGEFIYPLSNDDIFAANDVVSRITSTFLKKDCNVVITSRLKCGEDGTPICLIPLRSELKYVNRLSTREKQFKAFITEQYYDIASGSVLYLRKKFWENIGKFDERYILWEDGPFIAKVLSIDRIEICCDIVSIKYRRGGVSDGKKHPQLIKEKYMFDNCDKLAYASQLDWKSRTKIRFDIERNNANSLKEIIITYLRNPVGFIIRCIYKLTRKFAYSKEMKIQI